MTTNHSPSWGAVRVHCTGADPVQCTGADPVQCGGRSFCLPRLYSPLNGKCRLCTLEKLFIAKSDEMVSLNLRSEISGKCRHRNRHVLSAKLDKG